jgi:hypothetical protein
MGENDDLHPVIKLKGLHNECMLCIWKVALHMHKIIFKRVSDTRSLKQGFSFALYV